MSPGRPVSDKTKHYRVYLFDLYGTLVDIHTDERLPRLWKTMAPWYTARGADYTPAELRKAYRLAAAEETCRVKDLWEKRGIPVEYPEPDIGEVFRSLYAAKDVHADEQLIRDTAWTFRRAATMHLRLYAGARELLAAVRASGSRTFLFSNAQHLFTMPELEMLGIADLFDEIYISSDRGVRKPDPVFYRMPLQEYDLDPAECLMTGNDYLCDIRGAARAGMDGCYILTGLSPKGSRDTFKKDAKTAAFSQNHTDLRKTAALLGLY